MKPHARENDIITCERGHPLYRMTRDVFKHERSTADQLESLDPSMPVPEHLMRITHCRRCGAPWFRMKPGLFGGSEIHFEDGWR